MLESNFHMANKVFWKTIQLLRGEKKGSVRVLKDKTKHSLTEDKDILRRWREYMEEPLNLVEQQGTNITISGDEITQAVKSLQIGKDAGRHKSTGERELHYPCSRKETP
ncbi:unnamed protein product [Soboliphyme baturini]|uniref:SRP_SPB domain-containing protein n=1 Tax=Soboliphyme baturini TaxID=241478 RepID=A0A183IUM0_9BILA|nr:unnamed protein product [Soboliphyme baturini]